MYTQEENLSNYLSEEDTSNGRVYDGELHQHSPPEYVDAIMSQSQPIHPQPPPPPPSYELITGSNRSTDEQLPRYNDSLYCQKIPQLGSSSSLRTGENIDVCLDSPC